MIRGGFQEEMLHLATTLFPLGLKKECTCCTGIGSGFGAEGALEERR